MCASRAYLIKFHLTEYLYDCNVWNEFKEFRILESLIGDLLFEWVCQSRATSNFHVYINAMVEFWNTHVYYSDTQKYLNVRFNLIRQ